MNVDIIILLFMAVSTILGVVFACLAMARSYRFLRNIKPTVSVQNTSMPFDGRVANKSIATWAFTATMLLSLWLSSEYRTATKNADAKQNVQQANLQARDEIQAAYDAAAQPSLSLTAGQRQDTSIPAHGYVYVGQCDKQWIPNTRRFGSLPNCRADIPADGVKVISWKGDIIRDALPMGGQGRRQLGAEIGRVSAGYSVVLRKLIPTSLFPNGPQYYWGLVDLPNDMPKER